MTVVLDAAIVSAVFVAVGTVIYVRYTLKNPTQAVLASWAVIFTTNLLSFGTYWTTKDHSLTGNITNAGGATSSCVIFLTVARATWLSGRKPQFSKFQRWCLGTALGILALWIAITWLAGASGFLPNLLTQVLMVIGYLVTVDKLLFANSVSEPKYAWGCIAMSCLAGLCPAIAGGDVLAIVYSTRAVVSSTTMVLLIKHIERKNRRSP